MHAVGVRRAGAGLLLAVCAAASANAQSLSIVPEQTTYAVGEEVVVRLVSDGPPPDDVGEVAVFARLEFDGAVLADGVVEPVALSSFGGGSPWYQGAVGCASGSCDVLSALGGLFEPRIIDPPANDVWGTVRFTAATPGPVELSLAPAQDMYQGSPSTTYTGFGLNFFDQTEATPVTIAVVHAVPGSGPLAAAALALLTAAAGLRALHRRRA